MYTIYNIYIYNNIYEINKYICIYIKLGILLNYRNSNPYFCEICDEGA